MKEYIKFYAGIFSREGRRGYNKLHPLASKDIIQVREDVSKFMQPTPLYKALSTIIYGHLIPELNKIDDLRFSVWIKYYGMDAAESTIPLKFVQISPKQKVRLNASCNHICDDWGYQIGNTRLLEKAGEGYDVILVQQLAFLIARNMKLCKSCNDFANSLNLDTGTESNVENIRNCLLEGIFKYLELSDDATHFKNDHGVIFKLDTFRISVSQETQHMIIRINKKGGFKKKCKDFPYIKNTFQQIMNECSKRWNVIKSPPIINEPRMDQFNLQQSSPMQYEPYELYKRSVLRDPMIFKEVQRFVLALWQLKETTDPKLIAELKEKQLSDKLSIKEILNILKWHVQHSAPRFQSCWPSVKYIYIYFS